MPKVTVLMCVYNTEEEFLRQAIESILNQTFKDFEFLIINDGSTNNAENVILSYKDERIVYVKNEENLHLIRSLNKGLDLAKGEYIARFDSDDISCPQRLEKQVKYLDSNPKIGLLGTQYESFPKKRVSDGLTNPNDIKQALLVLSNQLGHPTVMFRNSIIKKHNLKYDLEALYTEDYKMWLDFAQVTDIANLDEVLLYYRRHKSSICSKNTIKQNINVQKIMFNAQSRFFNISAEEQLKIVQKLSNNEKIEPEDLIKIIEFTNKIKTKMRENCFSIEYRLNHIFAKFALKKCKKNFKYLKLLACKDLQIFFEK